MARNILQEIVENKRSELMLRKKHCPLSQLQQQIANAEPPRPFVEALRKRINQQQPAVIAEIKKASPSQGLIRADFSVKAIAESYARHGATCLSVLTDARYFQGQDDYLLQAKQACNLPILRKDFILDAYQIYESRAIGADCILLIVAILSEQQLIELAELAKALDLAVLVEVHTQPELQRANKLPIELIGINNRNLRNFTTDIQVSLQLQPQVAADKLLVTESGIHQRADIEKLLQHGIYGFLVGESLMRAEDPGAGLQRLFF